MHTRSAIKLFNVEMESALFVLGARGLGAGGRVCWCWGAWVWPDWGAISGLLGDQHALVCQPGRLQALLVGAALDPSPHPSHTPFQLFVTPWTVGRQAPLSMGILQARILKWVAMSSSRASSQLRDQTQVSQFLS